jgi:putative pyruvate formate lyase activating enzyme
MSIPRYLELHRRGLLSQRVREAVRLMSPCRLCPRRCGVDRLNGQRGVCGAGARVEVARAVPHFGEEPPLVARGGAGTVFFYRCSLRCLFCQNFAISQEGRGEGMEPVELAQIFLHLQDQGCENIDLVSPTHFLPAILEALDIAAGLGLCLPLVYNTHGYEAPEALALLDGVVDIYLPDMKYGESKAAALCSCAPDYPQINRRAVLEMHRQVGGLKLEGERAVRGLVVRHLVLPGGLAGSHRVLTYLARNLGTDTWVSIMAQYHPCYRATAHPILGRRVKPEEYEQVLSLVERLGFENYWVQALDSSETYLPDFSKEDPFRVEFPSDPGS